MAHLPYRLVIVGGAMLGHNAYAEKCRAAAGKNVLFTGRLAYEDSLLPSAYAAAKVFVLPSQSEVMPQCLYEAAAAGCKLIVSRNIPVAPSIRDHVDTFHPDKPAELAKLTEKAMAPQGDGGAARVPFRMRTWQDVADQIIGIYEELLGSKANGH